VACCKRRALHLRKQHLSSKSNAPRLENKEAQRLETLRAPHHSRKHIGIVLFLHALDSGYAA